MREHATQMARFARECLRRMRDLVQKLEPFLGKDTAMLDMRFGKSAMRKDPTFKPM